jgi:MFS family permease
MHAFWQSVRGYPVRAFAICYLVYAASQFDSAIFGYVLPAIRAEFGLTTGQTGTLIALASALAGLFLVGIGLLTDRRGRAKVLGFSTGATGLLIAAHALVLGPITLVIARAVTTAVGGSAYAVTGAVTAEEAPARYRGLIAGLLQTAYPLGWFLSGLLVAALIGDWGWRVTFLVGLLTVPLGWLVLKYLREPKRFLAAKQDGQPRASLRELFRGGRGPRVASLFTAQFLFVMAYSSSAFYLPTYFVDVRGLTLADSSLRVALANGIGVFGYILAALTGEFLLSRRTTVVVWTLLGASAFLWLIHGAQDLTTALIALALMSMFFYGTAAVKFALIAEVFPTHLRATGLAVCGSLAVSLGSALGPFLTAQIAELRGWDFAFTWFVTTPLFLAGFLYIFIKPLPSGLEVEDIQKLLEERADSARMREANAK